MELGLVYFIISGMVFIFCNLGSRTPGTLSAYSVFNKNQEKILGTLDSDGVNKMLGLNGNTGNSEPNYPPGFDKNSPTQICYCGSQKNYRQCCYWNRMSQSTGCTIGGSENVTRNNIYKTD